jgi:hypothetical protein
MHAAVMSVACVLGLPAAMACVTLLLAKLAMAPGMLAAFRVPVAIFGTRLVAFVLPFGVNTLFVLGWLVIFFHAGELEGTTRARRVGIAVWGRSAPPAAAE